MPVTYGFVRFNFTPVTTNDNWCHTAGNGIAVTIKRISWGGRHTTSTPYRTRWARGTSSPSVASPSYSNADYSSSNPAVSSSSTIAGGWGTPPTLAAEPSGLFSVDWDGRGGEGSLILPVGRGWFIFRTGGFNSNCISCRNSQGTTANLTNYGVWWEE